MARRHSHPGGADITVVVDGELSALPAAIEVAAYRITDELLTNVGRHASARACLVRISCREALEMTVADDGIGIAADAPAGVGLLAIRERAGELGGTVTIGPRPEGGTQVTIRIPLPSQSPREPHQVHEARTGAEAVTLAAELRPDVILMDIRMPDCSGIEATRRIVAEQPEIRILIVTMFEDDSSLFTAMRSGARGYVLKDADRSDMLRAIRAVGQGEAIFSPAVATRLMDYFVTLIVLWRTEFPELTERESEILELIAAGYRNADIARRLVLSPATVRNYVSAIFAKMQVAHRAEAIVKARRAGLGGPAS